jgi:hypothetical protein
VDQGIYDDRVAGALDDFEPNLEEVKERWQKSDLEIDSAVGEVHEEVERRQRLLGAAYPFTLDGGLLSYQPSRSCFYEFCLAISLAEQITGGSYERFPRAFERLSAILVRGYLGERSRYLHLGSPRDAEVGARFFDAMKVAAKETGEWFWGPDPDLPSEPSDTGDHGVDFVVWKPPSDTRLGSLFILGQCACGDGWAGKFGDVDLARYSKWFNRLSYVPPVRAFTTPFHIADGWLYEALKRAGLVFDRVRLTHLAEILHEGADYSAWSSRIRELTQLVVPLPSS